MQEVQNSKLVTLQKIRQLSVIFAPRCFRDVTKHRTACTALRVDVHGGYWMFRPFVSSPPSLIQRFLLIFLLIQLKPKHHRLDVLTILQRGVRGARSALFRDTHVFVFLTWRQP